MTIIRTLITGVVGILIGGVGMYIAEKKNFIDGCKEILEDDEEYVAPVDEVHID